MKKFCETLFSQFVILFRWVIFAGCIGIVVGLVGVAFHYGIDLAAALRYDYPWLLFLLPAGGALIVLLYRWCGMERDRGTNFVLVAVRENQPMPLRTTPLIFISTLLTHLVGGSSGREGAALQIGGSIASRLGRLLRLDDKDSRVAVMCGMSAAFSALFGTPLTAAIFSMEVVSVGVMYYAALVPCTLSALVGLQVAQLFHVTPVSYSLSGLPALSPAAALQVGGLSILFALLSILFCKIMHLAPALYTKYLPRPVVRAALGGVLVILLTLLVGTRDYNGAGMEVISRAIAGEASPAAFLLKILFTAVTLGAGFKGGEIVPVFFTGATFGCIAGPLLGLAPSFSAGLGMVSVFCGVTNCPMTSLLLAFELFGGAGLPFFALACAVSYMLSGYTGLYSEQKIVYSKVKPELINQKVD
jgi:H+/Cl- antiporter ClcA